MRGTHAPHHERQLTAVARTGFRPVTTRFHAGMMLVSCLIALQWLQWWTFLIALSFVTTLGVRFYWATFAGATTSTPGARGRPRTSYCRSTSCAVLPAPNGAAFPSGGHLSGRGRRLPAQHFTL